ncbi:MAG: hypothetical protein WED04_04715 [Promethearchaeati archaeon SRVP18_Atabeyarchaeia-1]
MCDQRGHFIVFDPPDFRMEQLLVIHNHPTNYKVMKSCYVVLWEDVKGFIFYAEAVTPNKHTETREVTLSHQDVQTARLITSQMRSVCREQRRQESKQRKV